MIKPTTGSELQSIICKKYPSEVATEIIIILQKHDVLDFLGNEMDVIISDNIVGIYRRIEEQIKKDECLLKERGIIK